MGVLRGQILRHPSQNCLVLADAFWEFENKIRFVSLIQPFPSRIYRSTVLRKPTRFTLKAAAMLDVDKRHFIPHPYVFLGLSLVGTATPQVLAQTVDPRGMVESPDWADRELIQSRDHSKSGYKIETNAERYPLVWMAFILIPKHT